MSKDTVNQPSRSNQEYVTVNGVKKRNLAYQHKTKRIHNGGDNVQTVKKDFIHDDHDDNEQSDLESDIVDKMYDTNVVHNIYSDVIYNDKKLTGEEFARMYTQENKNSEPFTIRFKTGTRNSLHDKINSDFLKEKYKNNPHVHVNQDTVDVTYDNADDFIQSEDLDDLKNISDTSRMLNNERYAFIDQNSRDNYVNKTIEEAFNNFDVYDLFFDAIQEYIDDRREDYYTSDFYSSDDDDFDTDQYSYLFDEAPSMYNEFTLEEYKESYNNIIGNGYLNPKLFGSPDMNWNIAINYIKSNILY